MRPHQQKIRAAMTSGLFICIAVPRDREIIGAYKRGESLLTIADRFGVTCADAQRIVAAVGSLGRVLAELPIDAGLAARRGLN